MRKADARRGLAITAGLACAVFFWNLGSYGLWEPDEARYAEIAREMLAMRDFILPHLNYVPYLEKPPLLYWLTALSFAIGGQHELSARIVPAVSALAGVFATWFFAARVFDYRRATMAAAILATAPLYAVMAQVLTTDMLLTSLVTVSLFTFFLFWREGRGWLWLFYASMGLGTLAKGPVAIVIPILAGVAFLACQGELKGELRRAASRFRLVSGLLLTLAIASPWFVTVMLRVPDFARVYFLDEHIRRFFEPTFSHPEPFYFFLPVLIVGFLPWSILAPLAASGATANRAARDFCLIAAGVIVVLFSIASGKLIPYVLPAFAPLAVVIADIVLSMPRRIEGAGARRFAFAAPIVPVLIGAVMVAAAIAAPMLSTPYAMAARPAILAAGVIAIAGGAVAGACRRRTVSVRAIIVVTMAAAILAGSYARREAEPLRSYASLCRAVAARAPDATLICYHRYVQALAYYSGRRVVLVGPPSELRFGMERSADAASYFLGTDDDLLRLWSAPGPKVMLIDEPDLERIRPRLGEFAVIASALEKRAILTAGGPVAGH